MCVAQDEGRWPKIAQAGLRQIAPKHESYIKYNRFCGFRSALQVPGGFRRAQDRPFGGFLGPLEGLLEAILRLKMA